MTSMVLVQRTALMDTLTDMLDDLVASVSIDSALVHPQPGKVAIYIEPPYVEYPTWDGAPDITWTLDIVAGTPATQATALDYIIDAIDRLAAKGLNINKAQPVEWNLAGTGTLAGYQVTLNPLEIIEAEE
ncbi:hypothetical protein [Bifidobacterium moukalabense]|uniref:DUF3168 domain-containing protein n=1 Tax=Bifidobacterium moukalabense DSM 27321 TaxID=1435051 RepID=W4N8K0_9BIFI|nr:hypothetical protein [Bifidobacterium moukalabense]ETY70995.1 hypothetical protein BMOU_1858 [Bifidobacterium moukalabense DSM 27321]